MAEFPEVVADFNDWDFNQDPYPRLEQWRALGPVVYNGHHEHYMVFSYRDCAKVMGNVAEFNSAMAAVQFEQSFGGITMEAIDTPRHHEMRGVWAPDFQRQNLERQRDLVTQVVERRLALFVERLRAGETVDAVANLTRSIPTLVIAEMLGIDVDQHAQFSAWSDAIGRLSAGRGDKSPRGRELVREGEAAAGSLHRYLGGIVAERRRAAPTDDLVATMVFHDFARSMAESEIVASVTQLVFAGNETTAKLMAAMIVALADHPDQRRALVADRSLIPQAIEELLRWNTVVTSLQARNACSSESNIRGIPIPFGAPMAAIVAAGNRDPQRWDRPERFDIFRTPRQHLGFGFGMHACLGLNLARLEAQIWLDRFLDLVPDYELAEVVDYGPSFLLRGPLAVPIVVG